MSSFGSDVASAIIGTAGSIYAGDAASDAQRAANTQNYNNQKKFAQNALTWKVDDARRAGINPLVALGAQTHQYSPSSTPVDGMATAMGNIGQNLSRAVRSMETKEERAAKDLQLAALQEDVNHKKLLNQALASDIATKNQAGSPPPKPGMNSAHDGLGVPGKGVLIKPSETTATMPGAPSQEAGIIPDIRWARSSSGGLIPVASTDVKESIEDSFIPETMHAIRNQIFPNFGAGPKPPRHLLPPGYDRWEFDRFTQEFIPKKGGKRDRKLEMMRKIDRKRSLTDKPYAKY